MRAAGWLPVTLTLAVALCFAGLPVSAAAGEISLEALLLWGTNEAKSPNPKHKPVSPELRERLKSLPLKWTNYFEETRKEFAVPQGASKRVALSDVCEVEVQNVDGATVCITQYGRGREVARQKQVMPKNEVVVLAGNAPGANAWLVVLKRAK